MNHKKTQGAKPKSRRYKYIAIIGLTCLIALAAGWVLLGTTPHPYRPATAANPDEVSPYLTHRLAPDFFNQVQLYEPFELTLEQDGLNDILCRWPWPQQIGEATVAAPVVIFQKDRIILMSRLTYHQASSVVTVTAVPAVDHQGRLTANIQSVRLGLVPVTGPALHIAEQTLNANAALFSDWPGLEAVFRAILTNTPFEPVFYFDKQRIWVERIAAEPQHLRVRLAPENKAVFKY